MSKALQNRTTALAVVASGLLALGAGAALANEVLSHATETLQACVVKSSGQMRIVSDATECRRGEVAIAWNVAGPAGPAGAQGPAGPAGPPGATTTYFYRSQQSEQGSAAQAFCLPGEKVTGGGAFVVGGGALTQNHPISDATGTIAYGTNAIGWQAAATNWSPVQVHVVCASSAPGYPTPPTPPAVTPPAG